MKVDNQHKEEQNEHSCGQPCEVYSRCCGYFRPIANWNLGKKEEFKDRVMFNIRPANCCEKKHG